MLTLTDFDGSDDHHLSPVLLGVIDCILSLPEHEAILQNSSWTRIDVLTGNGKTFHQLKDSKSFLLPEPTLRINSSQA